MNIVLFLYGCILGVLIGEIWECKKVLNEIEKYYDSNLEKGLKYLDE